MTSQHSRENQWLVQMFFPIEIVPFFGGANTLEVLGGSFEQLTISQWIFDSSGAWPSHKIIFATQFCVTILTEHWLVHKHGRTQPLQKDWNHHLPAKNPCSKNWRVQKFLTYCRPCRIRKNGHPGCLWMLITIPTSQKRVCFQSMKKMIISQCHRNPWWRVWGFDWDGGGI